MTDALGAPDLPQLLEHRAWVRALARRLCADENDVDDVEQETWTVAMRRRPDEPRALRSWLGVVASRLALQRIRGESRRVRREEAIAAPEAGERSTADVVATADAHGHVVHAVLALDEPYRTTVLLRYFEGLQIAAVARKMGVPIETVRTRLKRAHERLRTELAPDDDRALLLLLAPAVRTAAATASFAHSAAVVAGVVVLGAGGAWLLTTTPDGDGAKSAVVVAAVARGADGAAGQDGNPVKPAEPSPVTQDKPAPVAANDPWIAYDLADGRPIAGLKLVLTTWTVDARVTTDSEGRVEAERFKVNDIAVEPGSAWHFARPLSDAVKDEPSLWFWRERPVTGTVSSADPAKPLDPAAVRLKWFLPLTAGRGDQPGRSTKWMAQHGFLQLDGRTATLRIGPGGRLSGAAPAIPRARLMAEADGFAPATNPLEWSATGECAVAIVLRPPVTIVGRLLDEHGDAVVGERVRLQTNIDAATHEDAVLAQAMRRRSGYFDFGTPGPGFVSLIDEATTDARGTFRFDATAGGTNLVLVLKPGFVACRKEFGPTATDAAGFDLRLERSDVRVIVRDAGVLLASAKFSVQAADGRENDFSLTTDKDGRADAGWLQRGRWYRIDRRDIRTPGRITCFRWDAQATIDLDKLPKEPAEK